MISSTLISFVMMITFTSYIVLLLWRTIRKYYTSTRVSQRRRFGSGYWSRRKIYWRQRDISRTGYIVEALHSKSESQGRKEEILTKPCSDVLKRNSHAFSGVRPVLILATVAKYVINSLLPGMGPEFSSDVAGDGPDFDDMEISGNSFFCGRFGFWDYWRK